MKKYYYLFFAVFLSFIIFISCSDKGEEYIPVPVSPVTVNLSQVPYPKLSDYHFFEGELKNQIPSLNVLPYEPASSLFSDYAHKKRFVWMPLGTKATFVSDSKVLELPVGAVLIKTFYYENVQNIAPVGGTRIVETRLMIRKDTGWIFANYVWNEAQTDADFDLAGSFTDISWEDENNVIKSTSYRIPTEVQCMICHKNKQVIGPTEIDTYIPIGIKPQNLNFAYTYASGTKNQLTKWVEQGYLDSNFTLPTAENTVINYNDNTRPLELRVRSYLDSNCSHCHAIDRHCDYRPMRFPFNMTGGPNGQTNMGVCVDTEDYSFAPALTKIIKPGNVNRSMLYYRLNTTEESFRMPLHGRTVIHEEGVELIGQWINSLAPCP
ncbi:hypothetical protein [Flavobacterium wongokense]|uniref:hypothetical protein n=1 Tax=Flavobacterium wongokense TaxID=2910674 RepID=UPI001F2D20D9|nr:hypothetical protein [Flavobacterium sp. WG47]MCF6132883.1 hypothetical protein [Flavobacterium sp. WG47]